jgi:hypothetical protein
MGRPEVRELFQPEPLRTSATTFVSDDTVLDSIEADGGAEGTGILYMRDGLQYRLGDGQVVWIKDRNGNKTTIDRLNNDQEDFQVTDPLGRTVDVILDIPWSGEEGGYYDEITFHDASNTDRSIKVYRRPHWADLRCYGLVDPDKHKMVTCPPEEDLFEEFGELYTPEIGNTVWKIELPNGKVYRFNYNQYAEVSRIILPTGGVYEYEWDFGKDELGWVNPGAVYRRIQERRELPDSGESTAWTRWTSYSVEVHKNEDLGDPLSSGVYRCPVNSCTEATVTEKDSQGTLAVEQHYFYGDPLDWAFQDQNENWFYVPTTNYSPWAAGREFRTVRKSGASATLRDEVRTWWQRLTPTWWTDNHDPSYGPEPALDTRLMQSDHTGEDGRMARTAYGYSTSSTDNSNNVLYTLEYDYGDTSGGEGSLLRRTQISYETNADFTGGDPDPEVVDPRPHLRSLPVLKLVCNTTSKCSSMALSTPATNYETWVEPLAHARGSENG